MKCGIVVLVEIDPEYPLPQMEKEKKLKKQMLAAVVVAMDAVKKWMKPDYFYPDADAVRVVDIGVDRALSIIRESIEESRKWSGIERIGACSTFFLDITGSISAPRTTLTTETLERIKKFPERFWLVTLWYRY
jgi:hypothetical protein